MSWGKRASIIVECLFTAPRFASLSGEHPGRMGATMLGGVKRWLLAMLALALRVAPVPLRAFDSASASWGSGGVGTKGVPSRASACGLVAREDFEPRSHASPSTPHEFNSPHPSRGNAGPEAENIRQGEG